jgi:hypothetical protein
MANKYSMTCPNCHEKTAVSVRAAHERRDLGIEFEIAECNGCNYHVLLWRHSSSQKILKVFPNPLPKDTDSRIPEKIKEDYDEALLCLSVGAIRGAAILARRAVQTICKDKGAAKNDLKDQIDELFVNNIITKDLQSWAHEVRYVGNDAAHPNAQEVTPEDAEEIIDLLDSLCEVLYIAPAKAANRKKIRENKKALKK